jgi:hypothetical protein
MDPHLPKRRKPDETTQDVAADADEVGDLARGVSEFTQLALYMAATVAGLVTALLVARRPFFESLLRRAGGVGGASGKPRAPRAKRVASRQGASRRPVPPTREESLPLLAEAIIGNTKAAVASVFGPPRSAALRGVVKANAGSGSGYWNATTWYYPLPRNDTLAMAIEFEEESARRVEFFRAPGV